MKLYLEGPLMNLMKSRTRNSDILHDSMTNLDIKYRLFNGDEQLLHHDKMIERMV